jgi:REP element-mobilizing transposase RayT
MGAPLAYFLTWSCYGTRLHGDADGSVDKDHNRFGTPFLPADAARERGAEALMTQEPYSLSADARAIVDQTVRRHCEVRGWRLLALNARTTHVHVVVDCLQKARPELAMEQFKAWCTRKLREGGFAAADQKIWTEHGSTRWIDTAHSLAEAVEYVLHGQ